MEAIKDKVPTVVEFFGAEAARKFASGSVNLLIANNVLAHVPDLNDFLDGIAWMIGLHGVATLEFPHVLEMIKHTEFDTIYHEHYSYFSLLALGPALARHGLKIYDLERLPIHGGSLRIYVRRDLGFTKASKEVFHCYGSERKELLHELDTYRSFALRAYKIRQELSNVLLRAKVDGKKVAAFGAAAKGNTLMNFCSLDYHDITMVGDETPWKQGKLTPGSHIPVVPLEKMLESRPDYVLLLAWNWLDAILPKLAPIREWGGKVIVPIPVVRVID
jgi:hypothetical protein